MITVFNKQYELPIVVDEKAAEAVRLAALDLQRDLRGISGHLEGFPVVTCCEGAAIRIQTQNSGAAEGYTVTVSEEGITVEGYDLLGTVYGIYAVSTKILGVLPVHRVTDLFPAAREELVVAPMTIVAPARKVKFRGWFLNDEDLLTDFKTPTGPRYIDYPFYENVMNIDVLDRILETALRMEINLIIPSSFVDIANPYEEELVKAVCRRGLYITQHHVEPMGVSYFGADNYMKKYGQPGEAVSFVTNRGRMEEIWRFYAKKWAAYGDRVVWQLGLRGKADQSVWKSDKSIPMSSEGRGAIISDAIATQYRIITETLGTEDFCSTATLWMEGAQLYGEGHLKLPESTMVIFSDIGYSQMFSDDFYTVPRIPGRTYGIYYHVQFWGRGPHLAEGCDPRKMEFSYREARRLNSFDYVILNVSNMRPLHLSTWLSSRLLEDPENMDANMQMNHLLTALYGAEQLPLVRPLVDEYYDCIGDLGKDELKASAKRSEFFYHDYGPLTYPEFTVSDGVLRTTVLKQTYYGEACLNSIENYMEVLGKSEVKFVALYEKLQTIEEKISKEHQNYFRCFLKHQTFYMLQLTRWSMAFASLRYGLSDDPKAARDKAVSSLDAIVEDRKVLEQGYWEGWHNGDRKIGILEMREKTLELYEEIYG